MNSLRFGATLYVCYMPVKDLSIYRYLSIYNILSIYLSNVYSTAEQPLSYRLLLSPLLLQTLLKVSE